MTCIHCQKLPRSSPHAVYCRVCALAWQRAQESHYGLPWWQWPAYRMGEDEWRSYLSALIEALGEEPDPELVLACRPAGAPDLPEPAIRILHDDILVSSKEIP